MRPLPARDRDPYKRDDGLGTSQAVRCQKSTFTEYGLIS